VHICTIGFAGKTAEQFFALLQQAGVQKLLDVRENRGGQLSGYAKHPDLQFFLDRVGGIRYEHEPRLAPSREIRQAYRKSKDWDAYEAAFRDLMRERNVPEGLDLAALSGTVALLCSEAEPEKCHRRIVAELLAEALRGSGRAAEVRHLVTEKPGKQPRRKRKKGEPPA
jgi:uncharacterized protein (DUF488 family)